MTTPALTQLTDLSAEYARLYAQAFADPNEELHRLYEMAKRDQWNASALAWDGVDFTGVPAELRQALVNMYTQTHYGELGALMSTAKAVEKAPDLFAKLFGATQVMDEARHVEWFTRLIEKLGARAPVLPSVEQLITEVYASETAEELLVGMQIIIEGVAQTLFIEGGRMVRQIDTTQPGLEALAGLTTVVGDWMVNYVGKDETRHVGFGVLYVAQRLKELDARRRDALNAKAERWGGLIMKSVQDRAPDFATFGLDAQWLAEKCVKDQNERLRKAGLDARAPAA